MNFKLSLFNQDSPGTVSAPILIILISLIVGAITYLEITLKANSHQVTYISIKVDSEEILQDEQSLSASQDVLSAVESYWPTVEENVINFEHISTETSFSQLEPSDKNAFLALMTKRLIKRKRYLEGINILQKMEPDALSRQGLSFIYALALSQEGHDKLAAVEYQKHVTKFPNHQAAAINYGLILARLGEHEKATEILAVAANITSGAKLGKALSAQGGSLLSLGRNNEAKSVLKKAIEYRPNHSATWSKLALASSLSEGSPQAEVISAYIKANALDPKHFSPLYGLAQYLLSKGRYREAIAHYIAAHKLASNRFDIQMDRTINLYASGRTSSAKKLLKHLATNQVSKLQKNQINLLSAVVNKDKKGIKSAIKTLRKKAVIKNQRIHYLVTLGKIKLKKLNAVVPLIEMYQSFSIYELPLKMAYAKALYQKKDYNNAKVVQSSLVESGQKSSQFFYQYSRILLKKEEPLLAMEQIRQAYLLEPKSKKITLEFCSQSIEYGHIEQATMALNELLIIYPDYIKAHLKLVDIYEASDDIRSAISTLEQVSKLNESNLAVAYRLASIQVKNKSYDNALTTLDALLSWNSSHVDARLLKVEIYMQLTPSRQQELESELEKILRLEPDNVKALAFKKRNHASIK